MSEEQFVTVIPRSTRAGPGTKLHLLSKKSQKTLCQVGGNMLVKQPFYSTKGTLSKILKTLESPEWSVASRPLCKNCEKIARQRLYEEGAAL